MAIVNLSSRRSHGINRLHRSDLFADQRVQRSRRQHPHVSALPQNIHREFTIVRIRHFKQIAAILLQRPFLVRVPDLLRDLPCAEGTDQQLGHRGFLAPPENPVTCIAFLLYHCILPGIRCTLCLKRSDAARFGHIFTSVECRLDP